MTTATTKTTAELYADGIDLDVWAHGPAAGPPKWLKPAAAATPPAVEQPTPTVSEPAEPTVKARKVKAAKPPVANVCRLTLTINGVAYSVRPVVSDWHMAAWSLRKADGTVYHVTRDQNGPECDCPDATFREHSCKHCLAAVAAGLL